MKIIKAGRKFPLSFRAECKECGCLFEYDINEISNCQSTKYIDGYPIVNAYSCVRCPQCKTIVKHTPKDNETTKD